MSKVLKALQLAARGYYVFPCAQGQKIPAVKDWQNWATRDAETIRQHWQQNPDQNVAIYTGKFGDVSALIAVDVDENGKNGGATITALQAAGFEFPPTYTQHTPSGGRHLVYRARRAVRQGANKLGPGVDIRSRGGYIVAAGSSLGAGDYGAEQIIGPTDAPAWLVERCGEATAAPAPVQSEIVVAPARAEARAIEYLKSAPSGEAGSRNDTGYKVAAKLKDSGVSQAAAAELMAEHWRCNPPLEPSELAHVVNSAFRYGRSAPGSSAPEADFEPVVTAEGEHHPLVAAPKRKLKLEMYGDIEPDLSVRPLIRGVLDQGASSIIFGKPNAGKTFVALSMCYCIAAGTPWFGRRVERGSVLYVDGDGGKNIRKRIAALKRHFHENQDLPLAVVPEIIDLSRVGEDVSSIIFAAKELEARTGVPIALIVIDTLAKAIGGADENAGPDMGAFTNNVARIRQATTAHVMAVHHVGKNEQNGPRGHSSLNGAVDTTIKVAENLLTFDKQRDMQKGPPIGFTLQPVQIGTDVDGELVTSCVAVPHGIGAQQDFAPGPIKSRSNAAKALAVLEDMQLASRGEPIHANAWREEFVRRHYADNTKVGANTLRLASKTLIEARRISATDDARYSVTGIKSASLGVFDD